MQAQIFAATMGMTTVGTGHLLVGLVKAEDEVTGGLLGDLDQRLLESTVIRCYGRGDVGYARVKEMSPHLHRVILRASAYANSERRTLSGTAHLWQELLLEDGCHAHEILHAVGKDVEILKNQLNTLFGNIERPQIAGMIPPSDLPVTEKEKNAFQSNRNTGHPEQSHVLSQFSRNLTQEARELQLEPLIGREKEINAIIQVLGKKTKNNPVLIGEPGVGKTAVVEGLAERIVSGAVPDSMKNLKIYALDMARLVAGTRFRGDFEDRITRLIDAVQMDPDAVLFIDEIHTLIGGGGASEGAMDAANLLKPALARGAFRVIGATTHKEFRKYFEKDMALARRFQRIDVDEPSREDAINILFGIRDRYEEFHHVTIRDDALVAAVDYASRYVTDRYLPDKAIDLIDETASMRKMGIGVEKVNMVDNGIQLLQAVQSGDADLQNELMSQRVKDKVSRVIDYRDVAKVVSTWTGVPVEQIMNQETEKLIFLEERLNQRIIGQKEAVHAICNTLQRSAAGLGDPRRPMGVFLLLGTSGIGKTELCRALAGAYFGSEDALVRLDMSEYSEEIALTALIGSPPGYVGYGDGAKLTDSVLNRPYSVILFDEIEKAHPKVYNLLLQLFDNGELTDSTGRKVNFRNTIVLMSSNAGTSFDMDKQMGFGTPQTENYKKQLTNRLKNVFRPEFLGRIDEVIVMNVLTEADGAQIAENMLVEIQNRLKAREITLEWTSAIPLRIAKDGMDKASGARNIRRVIADQIENPLSVFILKNPEARTIRLDAGEDRILIEPWENIPQLMEPEAVKEDCHELKSTS